MPNSILKSVVFKTWGVGYYTAQISPHTYIHTHTSNLASARQLGGRNPPLVMNLHLVAYQEDNKVTKREKLTTIFLTIAPARESLDDSTNVSITAPSFDRPISECS